MSQADEQEPFAAVPGRLQSGVSRGYVSQKSVWSLGLKQNKTKSPQRVKVLADQI